jgi:NAD(P)-dependent dehydrogenase (short-subunit alcohol dehydrogenase family)
MGLENRVAVITGATGKLGSTLARSLAAQGARLALFSSNDERLRQLGESLDIPGDRWLHGAFDFTEPGAAGEAIRMVLDKFGRADILVHVVGGWIGGKSVTEVPANEVSQMLNQHLWTTFYMARAFIPQALANGWGRIVVISSPLASVPPANMSPYIIGKAAQEALVLSLAREVANTGVTANILQVKSIDAEHERDRQPSAKNASWTTPEEISAAILYLCSDEARVINGARIPLYGG